jgi:hypothetical protein
MDDLVRLLFLQPRPPPADSHAQELLMPLARQDLHVSHVNSQKKFGYEWWLAFEDQWKLAASHREGYLVAKRWLEELLGIEDFVRKLGDGAAPAKSQPASWTLRWVLRVAFSDEESRALIRKWVGGIVVHCEQARVLYNVDGDVVHLYRSRHLLQWSDVDGRVNVLSMVGRVLLNRAEVGLLERFQELWRFRRGSGDPLDHAAWLLALTYLGQGLPAEFRDRNIREWIGRFWAAYGVTR